MKSFSVIAITLALVVQCSCADEAEPAENVNQLRELYPAPWLPRPWPYPRPYPLPRPWPQPWPQPEPLPWPQPRPLPVPMDFALKDLPEVDISAEEEPKARQRRAILPRPKPWPRPWPKPFPRPGPKPWPRPFPRPWA
ncbi:protein TsetseEP-like isoform X2 [Dermacentor silvarum]|uniref:protein TsetseEP-like isoform X2 n=1 Tax=Dermacentor silvarum TaxID=543639 RepID=UPI002101C8AD|nr:protein TsetseEP-like isoform X2 [Dermacentor silvarum]